MDAIIHTFACHRSVYILKFNLYMISLKVKTVLMSFN
jgi:hypothetical protein